MCAVLSRYVSRTSSVLEFLNNIIGSQCTILMKDSNVIRHLKGEFYILNIYFIALISEQSMPDIYRERSIKRVTHLAGETNWFDYCND